MVVDAIPKFDFRGGHYIDFQLHRLSEALKDGLFYSETTGTVFWNNKLVRLEVLGPMVCLVRSYLSEKSLHVPVGMFKASAHLVSVGVPQRITFGICLIHYVHP